MEDLLQKKKEKIPIGRFYVTITDTDIGSVKSLYIIWKVFGPHDGEIWTKSYRTKWTKFWAFWQKMVNHFWESVDAILEYVFVT